MADCSKTLDWFSERDRLCESVEDRCDECPLCLDDDNLCSKGTQEHIDKLQEWSDSHAIKTRQSEFLKMFPNADIKDGVLDICPCSFDNTRIFMCGHNTIVDCDKCRKAYWLEEIN